MRRCVINWMSLSLVGLGSFLLGASVGLALTKDDDDEEYETEYIYSEFDSSLSGADTDGDYYSTFGGADIDGDEYIRHESEKAYRRRVNELYFDASTDVKDELEETYSYEGQEDDIEIIDTTPYIDEESGALVKDTTEGIVEIAEPYVISEDEYMYPTVFKEFEQSTLIYYESDDVLATDRDEVIKDVDELIGPSALTRFGEESGSDDVVFVRNIRLSTNFEVVREKGSYQELVLGIEDEDAEYEKAKRFFESIGDSKEG